MSAIQSLKSDAKQIFRQLSTQANINAEIYECSAEWIKNDRNRLHIVRRYDAKSAPSVVLKYAHRPIDEAGFSAILDSHLAAHSALSGNGVNTVPEVLSYDRAQQAYLMRFVAGETFLEICRNTIDHCSALQKAGAWLAAYHGNTVQQRRPFQPHFMVGHMQKLCRQMRSGERRIRAQNEFIKYAEAIGKHANDAEGCIGTIAAKHGDLNAHNILISKESTAVFDFIGADTAPVAYDIARFLQSYTQAVGDIDQIKKGCAVPRAAWDAFFDGYGLISADDPTAIFLSKVQVLTDWNRMQDKTTVRSILRLERIKKIARQAFA